MASMGGGSFSSGMLIAGKYRLQKQLGEGAMGVVWSAVNSATGGTVALKMIARSDQELQTRLVREARACGLIRHKNVVQVYDVGTTDTGDPFLVMELLQGETLAALLARKRRLPPNEAAGIARDVARALAAAHDQGIIHRDLKPANIFLHTEPGEDAPVVKVVDFGVSKNLGHNDGLRTIAGSAVGSPMYMSPEQARAERDVDYRADIWSLGVVLYEMLVGERPFLGESAEVIAQIAAAPIPRASKRVRKLDPDLDRIVSGCLTRDRNERLHPAGDVARQLDIHALPPGREPLPSLMDTGGYDAPPVATPSSGGAPFSPGIGPTSLQAGGSPGSGRTELRPSSEGGALRAAGVPASAPGAPAPLRGSVPQAPSSRSGGSPLQRSGSWGGPARDDEDLATRPLEAKLLAPRAAPTPDDDDWGRGGTIPIHPQHAVFAAGMSRPAPPAPPPLAPPAPPARDVAPEAHRQLQTTMPMEPIPGLQSMLGAPTQRLTPSTTPGAPRGAGPRKRPDKTSIVAFCVMIVASIAAVVVWRLTSARSAPTEPKGATPMSTASQSATVGESVPTASPPGGSNSSAAPAPTGSPTSTASVDSSPSAAPTSTPTPTTSAKKTAPAGTNKPPSPLPKTGATATATAKKKCGKFGICQ